MTEEAIKSFLKSYSELKARRDILDKIQNYSRDMDESNTYSQLMIKIQLFSTRKRNCIKRRSTYGPYGVL